MFQSALQGRELALILAQVALSCQIDKKDKKTRRFAVLSDIMPNIEKNTADFLVCRKWNIFS
jgi:hypothetical protein